MLKDYEKLANSINCFRTKDYRVFYAAPFFDTDLQIDIKWHKKHLEQLRRQANDPKLFKTNNEDDYVENVIRSIPLHEHILKTQTSRFETISKLMPKRIYRKISRISADIGGTPEYFVYSVRDGRYFFVSEKTTSEGIEWASQAGRICDVLRLNKTGTQ